MGWTTRVSLALLLGLAPGVGCANLLGISAPGADDGDADGGPPGGDCARVPAFGTPKDYDTGTTPVALAAGDLDHDGLRDVVAGEISTASLTIWHGVGSGSLGRQQSVDLPPPCSGVQQILVADMDADGYQDLVVNAGNGCASVLYLRQDPGQAGQFLPAVTAMASADPMAPLSAADLNHDGKLDLVAADNGTSVRMAFLNGAGTFDPGPSTPVVAPFESPVFPADYDDDGRTDVLVQANGRAQVLFQNVTDGTFKAPMPFGPVGGGSVAGGDLNGDGLADIVVVSDVGGQVLLQVAGAPGTFQAGAALTFTNTGFLAAIDVNGDQRLDLVTTEPDMSYLLQCAAPMAAGTFSTTKHTFGINPFNSALLDVDGDGRVDEVTSVVGAIEVRLQTP